MPVVPVWWPEDRERALALVAADFGGLGAREMGLPRPALDGALAAYACTPMLWPDDNDEFSSIERSVAPFGMRTTERIAAIVQEHFLSVDTRRTLAMELLALPHVSPESSALARSLPLLNCPDSPLAERTSVEIVSDDGRTATMNVNNQAAASGVLGFLALAKSREVCSPPFAHTPVGHVAAPVRTAGSVPVAKVRGSLLRHELDAYRTTPLGARFTHEVGRESGESLERTVLETWPEHPALARIHGLRRGQARGAALEAVWPENGLTRMALAASQMWVLSGERWRKEVASLEEATVAAMPSIRSRDVLTLTRGFVDFLVGWTISDTTFRVQAAPVRLATVPVESEFDDENSTLLVYGDTDVLKVTFATPLVAAYAVSVFRHAGDLRVNARR